MSLLVKVRLVSLHAVAKRWENFTCGARRAAALAQFRWLESTIWISGYLLSLTPSRVPFQKACRLSERNGCAVLPSIHDLPRD